MKYERTKEGYAEYLRSDHWKAFRREVLRRDKCRCVECHKFGWQVHHKVYRDDWEDAQLGDCVTLCRRCHEKQHGIEPSEKVIPITGVGKSSYTRIHKTEKSKDLRVLTRMIKRKKFKAFKKWKRAMKKRDKWKHPKSGRAPWKFKLNFSRRPHYVNRGTSSN